MRSSLPACAPGLPQVAPRASAYVRVSTSRQAEHETSLIDQIAAITAYCEARGMLLVDVYREPGASATDDNRPQFQSMIEAATARERPYDLVIVHSFSRFFRDQFEFERYRRKLAKAKVELVSITQDVGEGATGDLVRSILSKFDEYQSAETAKHVRRSMVANARQGFWNGSRPPMATRSWSRSAVATRRFSQSTKLKHHSFVASSPSTSKATARLDRSASRRSLHGSISGATAIAESRSTSRTAMPCSGGPPMRVLTTSIGRTPAPVSGDHGSNGCRWRSRRSSTNKPFRRSRHAWPSAIPDRPRLGSFLARRCLLESPDAVARRVMGHCRSGQASPVATGIMPAHVVPPAARRPVRGARSGWRSWTASCSMRWSSA